MDSLSLPYLTVPNPSAPAPSLARLYARPGFLLRRVHQISAAVFEDECRAVGLTPAQFGVMTVLRATPGLDQSSLARALGFDKVTVLRVLRGLESRGLVARLAPKGLEVVYGIQVAGTDEWKWGRTNHMVRRWKDHR